MTEENKENPNNDKLKTLEQGVVDSAVKFFEDQRTGGGEMSVLYGKLDRATGILIAARKDVQVLA